MTDIIDELRSLAAELLPGSTARVTLERTITELAQARAQLTHVQTRCTALLLLEVRDLRAQLAGDARAIARTCLLEAAQQARAAGLDPAAILAEPPR